MMKLLRSAVVGFLLLAPSVAAAQSCSGQFQSGLLCGNSGAGPGLPSAQSMTALLDRNFGGPSAQGTMLNRGASAWSATRTPVLGNPGTTTGTLGLASATGGTATLTPPAIAGATALQLPSVSGTLPSTAASPLVLNATTGALTCPTCVTGSAGALVINTTAVSGATTGQILYSDGSLLQAGGAVKATSIALGGATIGTDALAWTGTATGSGQLNAASFVPTSATVPTNGMYLSAANTLAFASNSTIRFTIANTGFLSSNSSGVGLGAGAASSTVATIFPNRADTTTGIGAQAAGNVSLIAGATERVRVATGAASVSDVGLPGTLFTGGTSTTTVPQIFVQPAGTTAATTWSTSGTIFGANVVSGFAGNFLDFHATGGASLFSVGSAGTVISAGSIQAAVNLIAGANNATATIGWSTKGLMTSPAAGSIQFGNIDAATATAQTTRVQSVVAGTAAANGANWTLIGSLPTGTGTSGDIIFQTGVKTGSGTTQGTATTALTLKGETQAALFAGPVTMAAALTYGGVTLSNTVSGTGSMVLSTGAALVTPSLGVATATSINGNIITAGTGTLTIAAGKTLTDTSGAGANLLLGSTGGGFSAYAGGSCTNQFARAISAAGAITCQTVANADLANSSVTIGSTNVALGATAATVSGLTLASPTFSGTFAGTYTIAGTPTLSGTFAGTPTLSGANFITLANLVQNPTAFSLLGNTTSGTANYAPFTIGGLTNKAAPTSSDILLLQDVAASGALKYCTIAQCISAVTGVTSITPGAGLTSILTATAPGSAITSTGTLSAASLSNAQTGTSYTFLDGDRAKLVTASNAAAQAYTLPQAGAASAFQAGWYSDIKNNSTALAGIVTITPTTSTINGATTLQLIPGQGVRIVSDGTNYQVAGSYGAGFYVHKNGTAQTGMTTGAYQQVTWSTAKFNIGGGTFASNRWTSPRAGLIDFNATTYYTADVNNTTNTNVLIKIIKNSAGTCNGTDVLAGPGAPWPGTLNFGMAQANGTDFTVGGDVYELCSFVNSASGGNGITIDGNAAHSHFSGAYR